MATLSIERADRDDAEADQRLYRDAETNFERSIEVFEQLRRDCPENLEDQNYLASCRRLCADVKCELGRSEEGVALYHEVAAQVERLARANPDVPRYRLALAGIRMNLGLCLKENDRADEAIASFATAIKLLRPLHKVNPDEPLYRRDLAFTLVEDGELLLAAEQYAQAKEELEEAKVLLEDLLKEQSDNDFVAHYLDKAEDFLEGIPKQP